MLSTFFGQLISGEGFMPHGMCYLWQPDLLALHVASDGVIALAYMTIPLTLVHLVRKRPDLQFNWIFLCFAAFIIACAATHLMEIWTIWHPAYWLSGGIKAATALASVVTSILLLKLLPSALSVPSPSALRDANSQLEREVADRVRSEEDLRRVNAGLEDRVAERTAQLVALNLTLTEDNARFALAADAVGLGYWELDVASNTLQWDARMFRLHGLARLDGAQPYALWSNSLHPEDRAKCEKEVAESLGSGDAFDTEFRVVRPDGAVRHLRATARIVHAPDGRALRMCGVNFDITDTKLADERFRLAIDAAPTGMLLMDSAGSIVLVNAQIENVFGYARDELLGRGIEMLVPERFRAHHPEFRRAYFGDPNARRMGAGRDLYGLRKDGTEVPIEIGLNPLHMSDGDFVLSSVVDITERNRATEHFRLALEAAPTGMLLMDDTGKIVLVNAQIETLFGYSRGDLLGQRIEMLVPERFRTHHPGFRAEFFRAPKARGMGAGRDLYGLRKDGSEVPVEIGLNPLHTSEGDFVLGSIVDLSQRREMDRMRADFVSTVSHELRTPLTSISGSLGLLQAGAMGVLPASAAEMVRIAYKNSGRLVRIINDILDIGKLEAGQLTLHLLSIPLAKLLQQTVEANGAFAEKCEVRFCLDAGSSDDRVTADPDRLIQILTNLLSNAAKFSSPGADVLIRVTPSPTTLRVEVEDFGPGIPEEFRGRIFDKFAQADSSSTRLFEGSGLGLSIARNLVEAMGGTIGFSSVVGRGTVFYIELPRAMTATPGAPESSVQPGGARHPAQLTTACVPSAIADRRLPRLLHVEDDADLRIVMRETLAGRARVIPASDLRDAERILREEHVDLVILDVLLPDGNGIDVVNRIAELVGRRVPIVVLSVLGDVPEEARCKLAAVLVKSSASAGEIATTIMSYLPQRRS